MIFAVYAGENDDSIKNNLGMPDYSYYFVLKSYLPVLEKLGSVFVIHSMEKAGAQLTQLYQDCVRYSEPFFFLSFTPPHTTIIDGIMPSITVFAWEYSSIPQEAWSGDEGHDWRLALGQQGMAITHSQFAVAAVRDAMGEDYPIVSVPAPMWDTYGARYRPGLQAVTPGVSHLEFRGCILDSNQLDLDAINEDNRKTAIAELVAANGETCERRVELSGVIYTGVMNPNDGRKNWLDLLTAFCWAFQDAEDATLIIKLTYFDAEVIWQQYIEAFYQLHPFKCRVLLIHGFLEDAAYNQLIEVTSYTVNSARGEGQCLPLMEFMAAGIPAVAPNHTAMADYINSENAFVVESSPEWNHWPHDPRLHFRTLRYRINWESLYNAYRASYELARHHQADYEVMSANAHRDLKDHSSRGIAGERLQHFFHGADRATRRNIFCWVAGHLRRLPGWRRRLLETYQSRLQLHSGESQI